MFNLTVRFLIAFLLLALPSWAVLIAQISYFGGFDSDFFSGTRYAILALIFFLFMVAIVWKVRALSPNFGFLLLFFYSFYISFHFIGSTEPFLIVEGLRHEIIFVLLSLLIFAFGLAVKNINYLPNLSFALCSVLINGMVAVIFAVWQFFDLSILEVLYRAPLYQMGNLTLAIGYRLTSTMVNPINFGAFMVLVFLVMTFGYEKRRIGLLVYCVASALLLLLVVGSLSRLALIAFLFVLVFLYIKSFSFFSVLGFGFALLITCFAFIVLYASGDLDFLPAFSRFENLFVLSTYTKNERVTNWAAAIESMQLYEYVWGRGIGASSPDSAVFNVTSARPIENSYITIFYQYGFVGFILFVALLVRFFYIGIGIGRVDKPFGRLVVSFALFFLVMHLGNDFVRNLPFSFYYWFFYVLFELNYLKVTLWMR